MKISKLRRSCCFVILLALSACNEPGLPDAHPKTADTPMVSQPVENNVAPDTLSVGQSTSHSTEYYLIVPGSRIGAIPLNTGAEQAIKILGKPDQEDAAMGKAWMTWLDKNNRQAGLRWDIYTAYRDTSMKEKTMQLIRTTDNSMTTASGIGVGSPLDAIGSAFPGLTYKGHYNQGKSNGTMSLYDVPKQGIAFEISLENDKKQCTAVIIYQPAKGLMAAYQIFLNINDWQLTNEVPGEKH